MARLTIGLKALALASRSLDVLAPDLAGRIMLHHFTLPRRKPNCDYRGRLPAGAERLIIRHGGSELTGWCWGRTGPAVLLVHGWEDHVGSMLPLVVPLLARGYRVLALDIPGHGLSARVGTDLLDCSRAVEAMVIAHGPFESIIAHSFGATAVSVMLARAPHRQPARMALLSPMRDMEQHLEVFASIALLSPARTARLRRLVTDRIGHAPASVSAVHAVRAFAMPGLVIHDRDDPVIPHAVGATIADAWPAASLLSTERLGHRRILRCPTVQDAVLRLHEPGALSASP
ncbi:MAG: alpha/beta fold hydrolase [Pseudomonadales bacterium]|nr:alpha/beta fold hydrolase [Pseudomonadales bacterium]